MYLRVARAKDGPHDAIAAQRAACERIAARHGATIVREYVDDGRPARLTQQTELQRLLADLEQFRDAAYVIVWDYARLGRDLQSLDEVIHRIQTCGAEVATTTGVETVERFIRTRLMDQVAEWANNDVDAADQLTTNKELSAAVQLVRHGRLNADQREALAVLVSIGASATLPTPVIAAVFNVIATCAQPEKTANTSNK
jgi:hypothetical protein